MGSSHSSCCWVFLYPLLPWAWDRLCSWAHIMVPRTNIISATVCRQDLSTGSILLVPLKLCYRNPNPQ